MIQRLGKVGKAGEKRDIWKDILELGSEDAIQGTSGDCLSSSESDGIACRTDPWIGGSL